MRKLALVFVFTFFPLAAFAEEGESNLKFYDERLEQFIQAPGIASEIDVDINGTIARTQIIQYFYNNTDSWQEGVYTFPLPDQAAVDKLAMVIGERRIVGFVAQKEKARQIYEKAKAEGRGTGLVEQHRPNLFRTSVANIPPRSLIAIEIGYQNDIVPDGHDFTFRMPMAITPRYDEFTPEEVMTLVSSGNITAAVDIAERIKLFHFEGGENPVSLNINLNSGFDISNIRSSSHKIRHQQKSGKIKIHPDQEILPGEQAFILTWHAKNPGETISFLHSEKIDETFFTHLIVMPPKKIKRVTKTPPRQVTLIIDTSGSMSGPSIRQAKAALKEAIHDLDDRDYFNIIRFESSTESLFRDTVPASRENVSKALKWVEKLEANGGTRMRPALQTAFAEPHIDGLLRQIVFITDGAIGYEASLGPYIKDNIRDARFYVVGIGSAPNQHLMRTIAMQGRGTFTFIGDVNETKEKMTGLFKKMKTPVLTNIQVDLPDGINAEIIPAKIPDLMQGEPVSVAIKSDAPLRKLTVRGTQDGKNWSRTVRAGDDGNAEGIGKIYARRKIQDLKFEDPTGKYADTEAEITRLGIEHQLISAYTSLVAVDEKILRPQAEHLVSRRYGPTLPKGWQLNDFDPREAAKAYDEIMQQDEADRPQNELKHKINLPQTATGWQLQLIIGLLLVLCATLPVLSRGKA